jgi:hypothetical protein
MEELLNIEQFCHWKFNKFNIIIIREFGGTFLGSKKALQKKKVQFFFKGGFVTI